MDFYTDNNPKHLAAVEGMLGTFPDYVKEAYAQLGETEKPELHKYAYADPDAGEFPMDTPANIFLGYAYGKSAGVSDVVLDRLTAAAKVHEVDLSSIDEAFAGVKEASNQAPELNPMDYALVVDLGGGETMPMYPIRDVDEVLKSANDLAGEFGQVPLQGFRRAAFNIVKKAYFLGLENQLPDRVLGVGADKTLHKQAAANFVARRTERFGKEAGELYEDIVRGAENCDSMEEFEQHMDLLCSMDEIYKVAYDTLRTRTPYEECLTGTDLNQLQKEAEQFVVLSDVAVPVAEFNQLAPEIVETEFAGEKKAALQGIVKAAAESGLNASALALECTEASRELLMKMSGADKQASLLPSLPGTPTPGATGASAPMAGAATGGLAQMSQMPGAGQGQITGNNLPGQQLPPLGGPVPIPGLKNTGAAPAATPAPAQTQQTA